MIILNKKRSFFIIILTSILLLSSCTYKGKEEKNQPKNGKNKVDIIKEKVDNMKLEEKIGQLVMVGFVGEELNDNIEKMLDNYYVGGVILFEENIKNTDQTLNLINSLKKINGKNNIPLFIAADEEGGKVTRLSNIFGNMPSGKNIGELDNEDYSFEIGSLISYRLKSIGFNLDFAPVLDINSNPRNPIIGDRAYGSTKESVSKHGIQVMKGIQSNNIVPTIKHFPGHGDTYIDSHLDLPVVDKDLKELKSMELVPFREAINNGADMVMIGHILFPKIDKENPATFSKEIITNILRKNLNYDKVIITDDMAMGAITKNYNIGEAAIKSLKAGTDIILVCHDYENQVQVIEAIDKAIKSGELTESEIDEKVYRIIKLKEEYGIKDETIDFVDIDKVNKKMKGLKNIEKR